MRRQHHFVAFALSIAAGTIGCRELADIDFEALVYIAAVTPDRVAAKGGTEVTLTGRNFGNDAIVRIDGVVVSATIRSERAITFVAPPGPAGTRMLTVTNGAETERGAEAVVVYARTDFHFGRRAPVLDELVQGLETGDFDGDRLDDLIVIKAGDSGATILRNSGAGEHFEEMDFLPGVLTGSIEDVDRDGLADVISGRGVYYSQGDGFTELVDRGLVSPGNVIHRMAVGDFDADRVPDVAFFEGPPAGLTDLAVGTLVIARTDNGQRGSYQRIEVPFVMGAFDPIIAADLDDDGADDVVFLTTEGRLTVLYSPLINPEISGALSTRLGSTRPTFELADIDRDGIIDVVYEGIDPFGIRRSFVGLGTGSRRIPFNDPIEQMQFCGRPEPALALRHWQTVTWAPPFAVPREDAFILADCGDAARMLGLLNGRLQALAVADFQGEGALPAVANLDGQGNMDLLVATADGVFPFYGGRQEHTPVVAANRAICPIAERCDRSAVALGDFGSGLTYAVVSGSTLALYRRPEDIGTGEPMLRKIPGGEDDRKLHRLLAGDTDGDGDDDLVVQYRDPTFRSHLVFFENAGETWVSGRAFDPLGAFAPGAEPGIDWIELWDLDDDGRTELLYSTGFANAAFSSTSTQSGGAFAATTVPLSGAQLIDLDSDGDLDIAGHPFIAQSIEVWIRSPGGFEKQTIPVELGAHDAHFEVSEDGAIELWVVGFDAVNLVQLDRYDVDRRRGALNCAIGAASRSDTSSRFSAPKSTETIS